VPIERDRLLVPRGISRLPTPVGDSDAATKKFVLTHAVDDNEIWDAKGDLAVGTGSDTAARLAVGTDTHVLTADSTQATGLKWAAAAGGGSVATDSIWDAAGDLAVGTGANTAARLAIGSNGDVLTVTAGAVVWGAAAGSGLTAAQVGARVALGI